MSESETPPAVVPMASLELEPRVRGLACGVEAFVLPGAFRICHDGLGAPHLWIDGEQGTESVKRTSSQILIFKGTIGKDAGQIMVKLMENISVRVVDEPERTFIPVSKIGGPGKIVLNDIRNYERALKKEYDDAPKNKKK